jgi:hypothetical protein
MGIPAFLQSEFSLTPAGTKNAGQVMLSRMRSGVVGIRKQTIDIPVDDEQFIGFVDHVASASTITENA